MVVTVVMLFIIQLITNTIMINNELTVESESFTNENKNNNKINLQNNTTIITPKIALPTH